MTRTLAPLRPRMRTAARDAMRSRDTDTLRVLRATLGALDNAEAVPVDAGVTATEVPRRELSELEVVGLVRAEAQEREQVATTYAALGRPEQARTLRREAAVLRRLLGD